MTTRLALAALAALLALALAAPLARADTTLVVNTLENMGEEEECEAGTECSLREALEAAELASGPGVVRIEIEVEGTIETEEEELAIELPEEAAKVLVEGPGAAKLRIDGEGESRVLSIEGAGEAVVSGLTIAHGTEAGFPYVGDGGGGLLVQESDVELRGVRVTGNEVTDSRWGGGIEIREEGSLTVRESEVDHNTVNDRSGGGIYANPGTELTLVDSTVADNVSDESGGGIATYHASASLTGSAVLGNKAGTEGGGISASQDIFGHGTLVVEDSEIAENEATTSGGGINVSAEAEVIESTIAGNSAMASGGGLFSEANELLLARSTVAANFAEGTGGGLFLTGSEAGPAPTEPEPNVTTVRESTISANEATEEDRERDQPGGGIVVNGNSETTIETSTVAANEGGAIRVAGELTLRNSTVSANSTETGTGGIFNEEDEGTIELESSILAGNTHAASAADCGGAIESGGYNLLGTESGCDWTGASGDQVGADPMLATLGDYGGPTETMPPQRRASAAINRGEDPGPTDQRGRARPVPSGAANTDVGAVEVQAPESVLAPSISPGLGVIVGNSLECLPGGWDTDTVADPAFSYAWRAGAEALGSGPTLEIEAAYVGKQIVCEVTADNGVEAVSAESAPLQVTMPVPVLEPTSLEFGQRAVGTGPSPNLALSVKNEGNADLDVLAVSNGGAAEFPFDAGECFAGALAPGESCEIEVGFAPTLRGAADAVLLIATDGGQREVALAGEGIEPVLSLEPPAIAFGSQRTGTASAIESVQIENSGNTPFAIGTPSLEGPGAAEFTLATGGCESRSLQPGESCTVSVAFAPASAGAQQAQLRVPGEREGTVALTGTGIEPVLVATPALLEFGSRPLSAGPSAPQLVVVRNEGTAAAQISSLAFAGPGAGQFQLGALDGCQGATLEPGGACSVEVLFAPVAAGSFDAELRLAGAGSGAVAGIALRGAAIAPEPPPSPPTARLQRPRGPLEVSAAGVLRPRLLCSSPSGSPCRTSLTLLRGDKRLGRWSGKLAAGANRQVPVRLSPSARRALAHQHRLSAVASVQTGAGQPNRTRVVLARR